MPPLPESKLDPILEKIMACWGIPGPGVGIVKEQQIVYAKGFGAKSLATQSPVRVDSIFGLASIGKCFVASAVMQLVEQGKIEDGLLMLVYQLIGGNKLNLAMNLLQLNLQDFLGDLESYTVLSKLYLRKDEPALSEKILQKAPIHNGC
jgi:hypothetical protein